MGFGFAFMFDALTLLVEGVFLRYCLIWGWCFSVWIMVVTIVVV